MSKESPKTLPNGVFKQQKPLTEIKYAVISILSMCIRFYVFKSIILPSIQPTEWPNGNITGQRTDVHPQDTYEIVPLTNVSLIIPCMCLNVRTLGQIHFSRNWTFTDLRG